MASVRKNAGVVGLGTMASRILGLVREMLMSRFTGGGLENSAFVLAFAIPNFFRRLFGEGALTAAFVPVFKGLVEEKRMEEARRLARAVLGMSTLVLSCAALLVIGTCSGVLSFLSVDDAGRLPKTLFLARTMIPYAVFICAAAFGMGVLNSLGRFAAAAFTPCILNLVWIGTLLALLCFPGASPWSRVRAVSWAVLIAGVLQAFAIFVAARRGGVALRPSSTGWKDANTALVWKRCLPALLGAGALQVNQLLDQWLAMYASEWAPSAINYADRLVELPLALFGTAFATVLLPTLSGRFREGGADAARETFRSGVRDMLLLMVPSAVGLAILSGEVTRVVYMGGLFGEEDAARVSRALACYSGGLVVFGLGKVLTPWFHAQGDTKTPLRVSLAMIGANFSLNALAVFCLPVQWRHVGIAGATVSTSAASCIALYLLARRRNGSFGMSAILRPSVKIFAASLAMGAVILSLRACIVEFSGTLFAASPSRARIFSLAALIAAGATTYAAAMLALDRAALKRILHPRRR